jgi:hypothetical protein
MERRSGVVFTSEFHCKLETRRSKREGGGDYYLQQYFSVKIDPGRSEIQRKLHASNPASSLPIFLY